MRPEEVDDILKGLAPKPLGMVDKEWMDAVNILTPPSESPFTKYRYDALGYARDVLKVKYLSKVQEEMLALISSKQHDDWHGKLAVGTAISYGKTFSGGIIINWYYDCRGPCIVATTAPSQQSVVDLLWKEVRLGRTRPDAKWGIGPHDFIGPQAPEMRRAPNWWARGYVAAKGENFKGRHVENMCFIFDEAVGLPELYFRMTKTMFKPNTDMLWICFYNPTDSSSIMYQEIIRPDSDWRVIELSNLEHPNVLAGLRGEPLPIPAAVSLEQVVEAIKDDCETINPDDRQATDFEFPPGSGNWLRPGSSFEGEYLGRWPSGSEADLWPDALWKACSSPMEWKDIVIYAEEIPRIGCDAARKDDKNDIHISWGDYSVYHESRSHADPMKTCGRLIELAEEWAERCNVSRKKFDMQPISGKHIPIKIDDDGVGGTIGSRLREQYYLTFQVGAGTIAARPNRYPNKRSELWFVTRDRAKLTKVHFGLLPRKTIVELERQAKAPTWELNSAGQRVVEEKDRTRERLGRSPDGMDAVNLSYYTIDFRTPEVLTVDKPTFHEKMEETRDERRRNANHFRLRHTGRRGLFGR